jgi:fluoride exporter
VTVLLVLLGGAVGAPLRYLADLAVQSRHDTVFPWGTFAVNVAGCFLLGGVAGAVYAGAAPEWLLTVVGTGFSGALTTFSTFGFETVRLVQDGARWAALANALGSLAAGLAACAAGWWVAGAGR